MINVLVAEMPRVQMDLVRGLIARVPDITSYNLADYLSLEEAVRATEPDVIVVDTGTEPLPRQYLHLLRQHAELNMLTIEAGGRRGALVEMQPQRRALGELSPARRGALVEMQPQRRALGELSPARLIDAIRAAAERTPA